MSYYIGGEARQEAVFLAYAQVKRIQELRREVTEFVQTILPNDPLLQEEVVAQAMKVLSRQNSSLRRDMEGRR